MSESARGGAEPERYFFLHLQKTAGTSLWQRMKESFDPERLYPGPDDGPKPDNTLLVETLLAAWARRRSEIRIVTGHFPLCTTELLDAEFRTFTVLREPVERTLSSLRHYREKTPAAAGLSLEEIYDDPWRQLIVRNHMVKMLSLTTDEMTGGLMTEVEFTPERLDRAKAALATVDVVGVQHRLEEFTRELCARFGWDLGAPRVANRTTPADDEPGLRDRIATENADDIALYEFALTLAQ